MPRRRKKFSTEGRSKAPADPVDKRSSTSLRPHVMAAYLASHKKYGPLYKRLAKGPAI
jgi:hypothetical protein